MNSHDHKKQTAEERERQKQEEYRRQMALEDQRRATKPKNNHDGEERKKDILGRGHKSRSTRSSSTD